MKNIIEARGLCKSFIIGKNSNNVLKNINLDIYEGDFTIIMGSSGSGKSTLLYSLSTMDNISGGSVKLLNKEIGNLSEKEAVKIRKAEISFVFQSINLLEDLTIFENIAYSGYLNRNKKEVNEKCESLMKRLGIYEEKDKYPSEISGGQKQRAAIARALINEPKMIFGDEITGALNSAAGNEVLNIMSEINEKGQSILMVTHDIKAAARGNRILYLKDGRIDGELNLSKYTKEEGEDREKEIFKFLKSKKW